MAVLGGEGKEGPELIRAYHNGDLEYIQWLPSRIDTPKFSSWSLGNEASFQTFEKEVIPWLSQYVKCWPRMSKQMTLLTCSERHDVHNAELKYLVMVCTALYGALFSA